MLKKIIASGSVAREKLLRGATLAGELVGKTLGPKGRNVIIQTAYHAPKITNDGVTLLRHCVLDDEIEDLGFQTVVEAAMKTNERAGDGTTTTGVIAAKLISDCAAEITKKEASGGLDGKSKADVVDMSRRILEARDEVVALLKDQAKPVKKGDINKIVSTSLGKVYPQYVEMVTDMVEKTGVDGYVSVEDNFGTKYGIDTTLSLGMRFLGSYANVLMTSEKIQNGQLIINRNREAVWEDVAVIVTNHNLETITVVTEIVKKVRAAGKRKMLIIGNGFEPSVVKTALAGLLDSLNGGDSTRVLLVKAPSLTTDQLEDVAAFVGARLVNKNLSDGDIALAGEVNIGGVRKVVVDEDNTMLEGGKGNVAERVKILKAEIENEKDIAFKEQCRRRLGALQSGFGIIRVGAPTEPERDYIKLKIEDAVNAAKAAMEEGYVKGGGLALKAAADKLGKSSIVYGSLLAPNERMKENTGGEFSVPATVIDPVKVTRLAVENAFSVASQLITADVAIAQHSKTLLEELKHGLFPSDRNDDFRDEENTQAKFLT